MEDYRKSRTSKGQSVLHTHSDVNVTVNNAPPAVKVGVLERDWLTALILAIFLGWLGIDSFYLGKTAKGLLKLFTLGLFGILWIIDIVMIATKSVNNIVWKEGSPQMKGHNSTKPRREKKQWSEMSSKEKLGGIVGLIVVAVVVIGLISAIASGGKKSTTNNASQPTASNSTSAPNTQTKPTAQPAKAKAWVQVATFSGDSAKRTDPFTLTGADAKLKYTQTGGQYATTSVYIVKKGDSLEKSGGFPEVTIDGDKTDETNLAKDAGDYYFDIHSANAGWTVTVEEYR